MSFLNDMDWVLLLYIYFKYGFSMSTKEIFLRIDIIKYFVLLFNFLNNLKFLLNFNFDDR